MDLDLIRQLQALGVSKATFSDSGSVLAVEFFDRPPEGGNLADTLAPPAVTDSPDDGELHDSVTDAALKFQRRRPRGDAA
jgi:hypothetical protein